MGDIAPTTQEQEQGVVALGSNAKVVHTTLLTNKPKNKEKQAKRTQQSDVT